jgi:hypothetical protein
VVILGLKNYYVSDLGILNKPIHVKRRSSLKPGLESQRISVLAPAPPT